MDQASTTVNGRPFVVTNRSVLAIAVPMTLAYLTTPLLGIVDTAVVGQFGDAALLGGLAAGALVFDVVFTTFNFLRSGTTGLVAQAFGRGDALEEQAVFWRAVLIAVVAGIVLAALAPLIAIAGQWFMGAEPRVSEAMDVYIRIRLLGAPFSLINYAILGYVLGRGEGGLGLVLQLVLNGINIVLCDPARPEARLGRRRRRLGDRHRRIRRHAARPRDRRPAVPGSAAPAAPSRARHRRHSCACCRSTATS